MQPPSASLSVGSREGGWQVFTQFAGFREYQARICMHSPSRSSRLVSFLAVSRSLLRRVCRRGKKGRREEGEKGRTREAQERTPAAGWLGGWMGRRAVRRQSRQESRGANDAKRSRRSSLSQSPCRQMRSKGLFLVLLCILCTCVLYLLVGDQPAPPAADLAQSSSQSLFSPATPPLDSHLSSDDDPHPLLLPLSTGPSRLVTRGDEGADESLQLLQSLGFVPNPRTYPTSRWLNVSLPVFVSCVQSAQTDLATAFVRRFQATFPSHLLVLYALALDEEELDAVRLAPLSLTAPPDGDSASTGEPQLQPELDDVRAASRRRAALSVPRR